MKREPSIDDRFDITDIRSRPRPSLARATQASPPSRHQPIYGVGDPVAPLDSSGPPSPTQRALLAHKRLLIATSALLSLALIGLIAMLTLRG